MEPETGAGRDHGRERMHRLHPLSPFFAISRSFFRIILPGLVFLFFAAGDKEEAWYMLAFLPAVVLSLVRYFTLRYRLMPDHMVLREGLFFRRNRHIPYDRIQNVDTSQNPLHQLFGVAEVRLETASGAEPEAVLRVLSLRALEEIRAGIFAGRESMPEQAPGEDVAAGRQSFFRMSPLDVIYFGLLSQKGLALLAGLVFLAWEFDVWERIGSVLPDAASVAWLLSPWILVVVGLLLFFALQGLTVVWAFLTLHDFRIERSRDDLRTTCGLWTRQTATLPRYRIQFLSVSESWLQRLFGRIQIKVLTAGGDSTKESQVSRKWLVPLVARGELESILAEVQPDVSFQGMEWQPVHPRARRRMFVRWMALLLIPAGLLARREPWWGGVALIVGGLVVYALATARARRLGFVLTDDAVLMRDGVLTLVRNAVRFSKIQSVSLSQTPFDRRHRMATLHVDTAGSGGSELAFAIPYLPLKTARRLVHRLAAATSSLAFRW